MAKYYTLVTDVGRAKMANAQVMGEKVSFSQIALGSSETKPRENQTALGKEEWRGPISNVSLDKDNPNWIVVEAVVPSHVGGFEIAEVGVYDEEGHLIVVGNHPKTYKPQMDEGTTKDVAIRIIIEVSNSEIVELKVDPSVVIATREYVESAIELAMASIDFSTVEKQIDQHVSNADIHVTAQDKKNWNAKETPSAAQQKATKALNDAKAYTDTHEQRTDNPHKVTKSQVGLSNVDNVKQASKSEFDAHSTDVNNPHKVTKEQVGLGNVSNHPIATKEEAEAGTINRYMSAMRTKELLDNRIQDVVTDLKYKEITMPKPEDLADVYPLGYSLTRSINATNANLWTNYIDAELGATSASGGRVQIITYRTHPSYVTTQRVIHYSFNDRHIIGIYERASHEPANGWGNFVPIYQEDNELRRIDTKPADYNDYHFGQTFMDVRGGGKALGYPQEHCLVITLRSHARQMTQWCYPNGYASTQMGAYIRQYHDGGPNKGWNPWMTIATNIDLDEQASEIKKVNDIATSAQKRADEAFQLGVKQKQATVDSLTSIGASLPSDPTWDRLQSEIKKADFVREARVEVSEGQTLINLDFYPKGIALYSRYNGNYFSLYNRFSTIKLVEGDGYIDSGIDISFSGETIKLSRPVKEIKYDLIFDVWGVEK